MPATDSFAGLSVGRDAPYRNGAAVTPDDGTDLTTVTRALWIGGAGNVKIDLVSGNTVTLNGATAGQVIQISAARVHATGTTATNIVALW